MQQRGNGESGTSQVGQDVPSIDLAAKALQTYRQDPNFWRTLTRTTFRIPPQPILQADGARWQWLYRRLRTQTQLFTWGSNGCGNLGHPFSLPQRPNVHEIDTSIRNVAWPKKVVLEDMPEEIGIVADVQCGVRRSRSSSSRGTPQARRLTFPRAYPMTTKDLHEPSTAIAQFSTGRSHVLGLADDGKVWQWNVEEARLIKPLHVDVSERRVTRVFAGWDRASMYVKGTGIVYWPHDTLLQSENTEADAVLIDTATIPGTRFSLAHTGQGDPTALESRIGQVTNHIVLEAYIIFTTKLNKVFLYRHDFPLPDLHPPDPVELTTFYPTSTDVPFEIRDLQGSFRSFAIFTTTGSVLMGNHTLLDAFHSAASDAKSTDSPLPQPIIIPALQNHSITSIAFGDHHFQALRSDGTVMAYGMDIQSCGALGIGFPEGTGPLRGLKITAFSSNGTMGDDVGRQVWFDPTMHQWLADMKKKGNVEGEAQARGKMVMATSEAPWQDMAAVIATGDFFEREGKKWEEGITKEGEMGSYFVLKVAAAGWHSAALVLVDGEKAEKARLKHIVPREAKEQGNGADWHGNSWEDIDAPWDQLSKALLGFARWLWMLGMMFLGLTARDEWVVAERERKIEQKEEGGDEIQYSWSAQPFPRLRLADGRVMPGKIDITE
ncbi:MAG: hypothetical protein Q9170_003191 [Blastenia crenularia]